MRSVHKVDVVIGSGTSLSAAAELTGRTVVGLLIPAAWTAAGIGFMASVDGTTFVQLRILDHLAEPPYGLDEYEILAADVPTAESIVIAVDPATFLHAAHIKVKSQTAGVAVNQGSARTVGVLVRDLGE